MSDLKSQIFYYLKKYHRGKENAITVRNLANEFRALKATDYEVRLALRELNLEGKPVVTFIEPPYGACYAIHQDEIDGYRANLISRLTAIKERIDALDRIRIEPEQMGLFGG